MRQSKTLAHPSRKLARGGAPSSYTPELAATICERIADGESLRSICQSSGMPNKSTVMTWLGKHTEFRDQYARARELQGDHYFDQVIEIADDTVGGDSDEVQAARLRVDARKWAAGKLRPKVYGDRIQIDDGDGSKTVQHLHLHAMLKDKSEDELGKLYLDALNGHVTIDDTPARDGARAIEKQRRRASD